MTADAKNGEQGPCDKKAVIGYLAGYVSSKIYVVWVPWKQEVIKTADVIFDEDITYRTDDIEAAVREEVVVLAEVPPLPEEDQDDLFEFDTDQIPWPRVELGTPIPSSPASPPEEEEAGGHLPSPESLTLDEESQKADDEPTDGHEADEAGRTDDSEFSGAEEEPRARSPS